MLNPDVPQQQSQVSFNPIFQQIIFAAAAFLTVIFTLQHHFYDNFSKHFLLGIVLLIAVQSVFSSILHGFISALSLVSNYLRRKNSVTANIKRKVQTGLKIQAVLFILTVASLIFAWSQDALTFWLIVPSLAASAMLAVRRVTKIKDEDLDALGQLAAMTDDPTNLAKLRIELFRKEAADGLRPHHPLLDTPIEQVTPEVLAAYEQTPFYQQLVAQQAAQQAAAEAEMDAYYRELDLQDQEHEKRMQEIYNNPSPFKKRDNL